MANETLGSLMNPSLIGDLTWTSNDWICIFKNLVKIGITPKIGLAILSLLKGFENVNFYEVLIKCQDEITPLLIFSLKIEAWKDSAFEILKFCLLEGPINGNLLERLLEKLKKVIIETKDPILIEFLLHLVLKYESSSINEKFSLEISNIFREIDYTPNPRWEKKFTIRSWMNNELTTGSNKRNLHRGLHNLGNSSY
jgi:hypothetical protein